MGNNVEKEGILRRQKVGAQTYLALLVVSFGSITYGYSAGVIGNTLGQPSFIQYMGLDKRANALDLISTMNGLYFTGGVLGALSLPWVADKYGRKWACGFPAIVAIISGALLTGSVNPAMFIVFRFFAGAAAFMLLAAVPLYVSEIVPANRRGALVGAHGATLSVGYVISAWTGVGFFYWTTGGSNTWRPPMALQMLWPLIMLIGLYPLPESPRWLMMKGRHEEAEAVLFKLHTDPSDPNNDAAAAESYQIRKQIAIDQTLGNSWLQIIKKPSYRKRALFAMLITGAGQCAGPLVINNYGPSIYKSLGLSVANQLIYPAAWLTHGTGMEYLGVFFIDWFPRQRMISIGLMGCSICLAIEAALTAQFVPSDNAPALRAAVAMFFVWFCFYGFFLEGVQFAYVTEIFPNHLRAKGTCLAIAMISLMNIVWLQSAPSAFLHIKWRFYLVFVILCFVLSIFIWVFFPDTRKLALEEIAALFGDQDEIAIYQKDIVIAPGTHAIVENHSPMGEKAQLSRYESEDINV